MGGCYGLATVMLVPSLSLSGSPSCMVAPPGVGVGVGVLVGLGVGVSLGRVPVLS
jgi:hypothetical protein